jgi:AhpD family alkylhydroperoxidase
MDAVGAKARTIPPALKELAQLKVAALVGCPF